jgi:hypothetical protein
VEDFRQYYRRQVITLFEIDVKLSQIEFISQDLKVIISQDSNLEKDIEKPATAICLSLDLLKKNLRDWLDDIKHIYSSQDVSTKQPLEQLQELTFFIKKRERRDATKYLLGVLESIQQNKERTQIKELVDKFQAGSSNQRTYYNQIEHIVANTNHFMEVSIGEKIKHELEAVNTRTWDPDLEQIIQWEMYLENTFSQINDQIDKIKTNCDASEEINLLQSLINRIQPNKNFE